MLPVHQGTAVPGDDHAGRRPLSARRPGRRLVAMLGTALLVGAGVSATTAVVAAEPAAAVTALSNGRLVCDQNTLYAVNGAGKVVAVDITQGSTAGQNVPVTDLGTEGNNGLGISREGVSMFAASNGTSATIKQYDPKTGQVLAAIPTDATHSVIRGAVNPVTGIYYYGDATRIWAYDPASGKTLGQVGTLTGMTTTNSNGGTSVNGDFAFSSRGLMFVVAAHKVYRVDATELPTTTMPAGGRNLSTTEIGTLPNGTNSPGIAFSSDGYLYVSSSATANNVATTTVYQLDPTSGAEQRRFTISGDFGATDLATCNYADTVTGQASIDDRWKDTDQFTLAIAGDGIKATSPGASGTTTGNAPGVQTKTAGALLTTPDKDYTVTQTPAGTTDPANYETTWRAVDLSTSRTVANGTGGTAAFRFPQAATADGTDVVVTFTNTLKLAHVTTRPDAYRTPVGTALTVPAADGLLGNDTGTGLTVQSAGSPAHGTVTTSPDGSFTYTPAKGFSGTDQFTYTAADGSGRTSTSTVTVTVSPTGADDAFSVHAGATAKADAATGLLANDGGSDLTITGHTDPAHGTLVLGKDGSYSYTPAKGFSGTDSFTYTATDGTGATTKATVTVTVLPTAGADTVTVTAGSPTTGAAPGLLGNDQGTGLTVTGSTQPAHGTVSVGTDGSYTYTPAGGFSGNDAFDYTVTDGNGKTDTVTVTVLVRPAAVDDTITLPAGGTATATTRADGVLGNDRGTDLTIRSNTLPAHGALALNPDGTYTYMPSVGFSGTDTFTYQATDSTGTVVSGTVTLVVVPKAAADDAATTANEPVAIDAAANDKGTDLTTKVVTAPAHGTAVVNGDGTVEYTPTRDWSGTDTFTYTVTDAAGRTSEPATVTVAVSPLARPDTTSTTAGTPVTVAATTMTSNDSGTGLTVTGVGRASNGTVVLGTDGNAVFTPADGFSGTGSFWYDVRDASGRTDSTWVVVVVGPQATADTATVPASTTLTVPVAEGVLANDHGTGLTATLDEQPLHGTVDLAADGSYTYTPTADWSGSDRFTYTAKDSSDSKQTSTGLVTITVTPRTEDDRVRTAAGQPVTVTSGDLTRNDHGSGLTVTSVGQSSAGAVVLNADGTVTYTPAPGTSGTATFTYGVTGANGNTATGTVTVTITPVVAATDSDATADGTLVVPADQGVLEGATGTDLTVTGNTTPGHGTVEVGKDGSYTYTPEAGYSGKDTFEVTITDGSGNTTTGTVTITVAPKAVDDTASTTAGTPVDVAVTTNDKGSALRVTGVGAAADGTARVTDAGVTYTPRPGFSGTDAFTYTVTDGSGATATATVRVTVAPTAADDVLQTAAGTPLAIAAGTLTGNDAGAALTVTGTTKPRHGTVTKAADGSLVYTPTAGWSGTDTFTYTVTDASGQTATATVTVLVGTVARADRATTTTDGTLRVSAASGVLTDDSGAGLWAKVDRKPQHGTVELRKDGSYVYTPAKGFSGTDTFTYTAVDAEGQTATGLVTITVTPTAGADATRTTAGTPVTVRGPGVLGNDHGSALRVASVGRAQHGTVRIAADGTFVYTPAAGFSGVDTVTYDVVDAEGQRAEALVTITVGIEAADDSARTVAGTAVARDARHGLLGNDRGTGLTAALDRKPAHGTVSVQRDGSYVYTPAAGFTGTDRFTYTVTDASGQTTTATATMTVVAAATAADDSATGAVDHAVTIRPTDNDHASGGAHFVASTLHLVDPATGAPTDRVVVDGMGTWQVERGQVVFTPEHGWAARTSIDYTVADSAAQAVRATLEVYYPTGIAAVTHIAKLAFTGTTGLVGLGLAAVAMVLAGVFLVTRRRFGAGSAVTTTEGRRRTGA
ncbi:Ig-like domain-containing protein [Curtobacterium caseinilyticum]|uniref:Ig-like domain-containing protein n=1 Tax=Curtobacterium caseinilyticum TaxID=3055137 RepID=A0ABT7TRH9_9MICO|nr:Ig-like domain-containing protein [Curtobacterium caseinilyticum]MDM7891949.1 Ig-like domain-containing protein [Curtobacterium caseinilyticum]